MTAKLAALQRLHDAVVEVAMVTPDMLEAALGDDWDLSYNDILDASDGSLDAFKALLAHLLRGWKFNVRFAQHADGYYCEIAGPVPGDAPKWTFAPLFSGKASELSRAGLAAIIKALMAQEGE